MFLVVFHLQHNLPLVCLLLGSKIITFTVTNHTLFLTFPKCEGQEGCVCCGLKVWSRPLFCVALLFHFPQYLVELLVHDVSLCPLDCRRVRIKQTNKKPQQIRTNRPEQQQQEERVDLPISSVLWPYQRWGSGGQAGSGWLMYESLARDFHVNGAPRDDGSSGSS